MSTQIRVVQNDKDYDLPFTLLNNDGTPLDVSGATPINFNVQKANTSALKFTRVMAVVDGVNGKVKATIGAGDFDQAGDYYAEIEVTYGAGQRTTFSEIVIKCLQELPIT